MEITKQQKKGIIITAGVLFVGIVGYFVLKPKKQDTGGQANDPTNNNDIPNNTFDPAKTAETLYQSMKDLGTDEELIFFTLKNVNQNQFAQVIEAFGSRNYNSFSGNTLSWVKHPLPFWLRNELSNSDYSTLRLKYPNLL